MGQLVDKNDLRVPFEHGIQVQFLELGSSVLDDPAADDLKVVDQLLGGPPAMALDETDGDIGPSPFATATLVEHGERLAHPRGCTDVDAEPSGGFDRPVLRPVPFRSTRVRNL